MTPPQPAAYFNVCAALHGARAIMQERGHSVNAWAAMAGVPGSTLHDWLRPEHAISDVAGMLRALAIASVQVWAYPDATCTPLEAAVYAGELADYLRDGLR